MTKNKLNIIGISGKAGTGKDYIAQKYFVQQYSYKTFSFAWHFKVWLIGKGVATFDEVFATKPPAVRKMLQLEGTEYGRDVYGPDVWCNTALTWMQTLADNGYGTNYVIADCRFPNEAAFIHSRGGKVIRIHAPRRAENNSLTEEARQHISETALDEYTKFDYIVNNNYDDSRLLDADIKSIMDEL